MYGGRREGGKGGVVAYILRPKVVCSNGSPAGRMTKTKEEEGGTGLYIEKAL